MPNNKRVAIDSSCFLGSRGFPPLKPLRTNELADYRQRRLSARSARLIYLDEDAMNDNIGKLREIERLIPNSGISVDVFEHLYPGECYIEPFETRQ
jgi:hypothetical protein